MVFSNYQKQSKKEKKKKKPNQTIIYSIRWLFSEITAFTSFPWKIK